MKDILTCGADKHAIQTASLVHEQAAFNKNLRDELSNARSLNESSLSYSKLPENHPEEIEISEEDLSKTHLDSNVMTGSEHNTNGDVLLRQNSKPHSTNARSSHLRSNPARNSSDTGMNSSPSWSKLIETMGDAESEKKCSFLDENDLRQSKTCGNDAENPSQEHSPTTDTATVFKSQFGEISCTAGKLANENEVKVSHLEKRVNKRNRK